MSSSRLRNFLYLNRFKFVILAALETAFHHCDVMINARSAIFRARFRFGFYAKLEWSLTAAGKCSQRFLSQPAASATCRLKRAPPNDGPTAKTTRACSPDTIVVLSTPAK